MSTQPISVRFKDRFQGMIGNGSGMTRVFSLVERIAPYFRTVLVTGETGTGKELVARALHDLSQVRRSHFVVLNCSAIVETLFESELFGHTRGSFTGAHADKMGLIEYANGGTLFLDEIGDMPLSTQARLLRVLQNREVQRVGSLSARKVELRVVAATNKDLRKAVAEKQFREELFYRLSMMDVHLPPLRERIDDLPQLVVHFAREWSQRLSKPVNGITDGVRKILREHKWPGNIRELENVVGHACMVTGSPTLDTCDLPDYLAPVANQQMEARVAIPETLSLRAADSIDELELRLVRQTLEDVGGNQLKAARLLHTTRDKLRYRIKKYGLVTQGRHLQAVSGHRGA